MRPLAAWRPVLRLARRDARRHLTRTILATLLIALPIAGLVGYLGFGAADSPDSARALAEIPDGAQAVVTAKALPQGGAPLPQIPEGLPGPIGDDPELVPADAAALAAALDPGIGLGEFWISPQLYVTAELELRPGERREAGAGAARLTALDLDRLALAELREADAETLAVLAPAPEIGRLPESGDEVLLGHGLAAALGVSVGDTVGFLAPPDSGWRSAAGNTAAAMQDSERGYLVVGIAAETSSGSAPRAWAGEGWLSGLVAEHPEGIPRHWLALGDAPVTWEQAKRLNDLQAFAVSREVLTHYPAASELYPVPIDAMVYLEAAVGLILTALLGGLLVLFLVTPAFAVSAEQSRRSLGLAAAAGAAPRDLRRIVLAQGLVIGLGGGALGAVLGFAAALGLVAWVEAESAGSTTLTASASVAAMLGQYPWWAPMAGVLVALGLGLIAALPPARRAARLVPVDALRDRRSAKPKPGRTRRLALALSGPALLAAAAVVGWLAFRLPLGELPDDPMAYMGGSAPPGAAAIGWLVVLAVALAAAGLVFGVRALVAWLGGRGAGRRPVTRLALRDAADHPSRTVPAALGVLFSFAAASSLLVTGASMQADMDDAHGRVDWNGTFLVAARTPVSADFDRALVAGALAAQRADLPEIESGVPVHAVAAASPVSLRALMPEGGECPEGMAVHQRSAFDPEAPLSCVSAHSRAAYGTGIRFGGLASWDLPMLFDGAAMRATGLPGAEAAARVLDAGGAAVDNAALIDAEGMVRIAAGPRDARGEVSGDRVERVPGVFLRGLGAPFAMAPAAAERLGAELDFVGEIARVSSPVDDARLGGLWRSDAGRLVFFAIPDTDDPLTGVDDPLSRAMGWAPILLLAFVAVAATAVAVLLSATQARRDAATMRAVGADRGLLVRLGLARAGVILVLGVPAGLAAGLGIGAYQVAWNRHLEASGAWLHTVPVWGAQLGIALGVIVAGLAAALILARPPRLLVRRSLD